MLLKLYIAHNYYKLNYHPRTGKCAPRLSTTNNKQSNHMLAAHYQIIARSCKKCHITVLGLTAAPEGRV